MEMTLYVYANLLINTLFRPLNNFCLLFVIIGELNFSIGDFGMAVGQHVD
jgi:hypothetical protein